MAALEKLVFTDPWPEMAYVQEIYFNPIAHYFVLETWRRFADVSWLFRRQPLEVSIQGFAGFRAKAGEGHISTLAVHPRWRGRGFGELLLITVLEKAIELDTQTVTLEVRVSNEIAKSLYRKYAFYRIKKMPRYYKDGEDAALMEVDTSDLGYDQWLQERRQVVETRIASLQSPAADAFWNDSI